MKKLILTTSLILISIFIYAGLYLVTDLNNKSKLTIKTGKYTEIIPIEIKNDKCVISEAVYLENKDTIDNLGITFVIREVADDEWITNEIKK